MIATNLNAAGQSALQSFIVDVTKSDFVHANAAKAYFNEITNWQHDDPSNIDDPIAVIEITHHVTKSGNPETFWLMADMVDWAEDEN